MIYEEDAEEWALYLKEVFLHVVKREAVLLYCLENYCFWDFELLSLNSYKCKLLILSNGLLKDLSPKKCQFLEKVLHSAESVVTLLCGVTSSDQLYKSLNIPGGRWEMSTEQEPQDYIAVIESIIFRGNVAKCSLYFFITEKSKFFLNQWISDIRIKKKNGSQLYVICMLHFPQMHEGS